jgi:hypothetical protein
MLQINPEEKEKIFRQAKNRLGAPLRKIQLDDDQMFTLLETSTEDYIEYIQNFLIEHQWLNLLGLNVTEDDITRALTTRNYDLLTQYTYAYSKIVGLGAGDSGYELKKDYVVLRKGVQIYEIPARREVNEVMWYTPATLDQSVIDPFLGVWNNQFGAEYIGLGSYYILPAFDILLRAGDRNLKNRIIRSELIYKITNGPNGTKFLHLMGVPGGRFDFRSALIDQARVWYWYYDTPAKGDGCDQEALNKLKDVIKTPADVPLMDMSFDDMNAPSKVWIRRYFIALCKETLGRVRGTFSGKVAIPEADLTMDYESLLTEARNEMELLKKELSERLLRLSPLEMSKRMAEEAENLNKALKFRPFTRPIRYI